MNTTQLKTNDHIIIKKPRAGYETVFAVDEVYLLIDNQTLIRVEPNPDIRVEYRLIDVIMGADFWVQPALFDDKLPENNVPKLLNLDNLYKNIQLWSIQRNLHDANPEKQMLKLLEETGELASAILKNKPDKIQDGLGDIFVVLTILAQQLGTDLPTSVNLAWQEIKDRKGKTINGSFVKESDLT